MVLVYITLNTMEEGQRLAQLLIERKLTNCVNFHPITCTYVWEGKVTTEPEIVALVKTRAEQFDAVALAPSSMVTSPMTWAEGSTQAPGWTRGAWLHSVVRS